MLNDDHSWKAYRLDITKEKDRFDFIKKQIISFTDNKKIRFWITNYWNPQSEPNPHLWFRVYISREEQQIVESYLDTLVSRGVLLKRSPAEIWNPKDDAKNRIISAKDKIEKSAEALTVPGYPPIMKEYLSSLNSDEERVEQLSHLFESIGECTKILYNSLDKKPIDPYVMSLALHILLNSLTFSGPNVYSEEYRIRVFPVI